MKHTTADQMVQDMLEIDRVKRNAERKWTSLDTWLIVLSVLEVASVTGMLILF